MNINKDKINNIILATKHHSLDQFDLSQHHPDARKINLNPLYADEIKLFLDIDMLVFSKKFEDYLSDVAKLRLEFILFDDKQWKKGRLEFLKKLSQRKRIYYNDSFYQKYEKIARENIVKEIAMIEDKDRNINNSISSKVK